MRPVVINNTNVSPNDNSKYKYTFPTTNKFEGDQIAMSNIYINYSWFNIMEQYNNNQFSYKWTDGSGTTTKLVKIKDGYYNGSTLNAYLQYIMLNNGHYLIDDTGAYVYYLEMVVNITYYALEFRAYPLPTSLPTGWSNPAGIVFPLLASTPQFVIPNSKITRLLGFNAGTYPSAVQATTYNELSQNTPQVTDVDSIIVLCSLLNNRLSVPNTILYSFSTANRQFGELIYFSVPELVFTDISDGFYDRFEVSFVDQNFNPLGIRDTNLVVQLVFRKRDYFEIRK